MTAGSLDEGRPIQNIPLDLPFGTVFAVAIGNALEFYDFLAFSLFAVQIGHTFFPAERTSHGLLFTLATFGAGFVTRPLGGIVIGTYGDRVGRRPAMLLSFMLMGAAIFGLALVPSYTRIGISAPILLLLCRLVQGFALGGEVGPSTAFLVEAAPAGRRGFYTALQTATQSLAVLAAGAVGLILSSWLDPAALDAWGWRLAFLFGVVIVPVGLLVRRSLPETLHPADRAPAEGRGIPVRLAVISFLLLAATTICVYILSYMTTYAQDSLHLPARQAFGATVVTGVVLIVTCLSSGLLSDRIGRKPVMLGGAAALLVLTVPVYIAMNLNPTAATIYGGTAVLAIGIGLFTPVVVAIAESLPKNARSGGMAMLYAFAIAIFGGTTQFALKWLVDATGSALVPAWYMTGAAAIAAVGIALMPESAAVRRGP